MASNNNIGPNRLVIGAHYGLRDWLAQRVTAIVMAAYTIILLVVFMMGNNYSYEGWASLFSRQWFKVITFAVFASLFYHAWVGMRNIWMDYISNSIALRIVFHAATILWLLGCAGWAAQIIWRA
ncbi:MAG TPA: succinate dehydrogenase, hydrophobic membrane anchor protein [Noviherbaspirillum sp.]|jgi:succinate dehydrogenase / fumarate reductase membrane anchor subunit|uniref:succinate dehydrogenase, hydrophobic membrane anchor protein n=1 Tax=Noviherbaspirillum sp. TaxID=1926288 RepID=UPI002F926D8C